MDAEQLACTPEEIKELREIARSTHAGIWRIKRAKIILGSIEGRTVQELVLDVRVVPESIKKCLRQFVEKRMRFFDKPHRAPTWRETAAERVLLLLDHPPPKRSRKWDQVKVRYYGRDFSAREIQDIRELIASEPQWPRQRIARWLCIKYNLYQDNGKPRVTTAAIMLKRMDMDNMIQLRPNPLNTKIGKQDNKTFTQVHEPGKELSLDAVKQNPIQFVPVTTAEDNDLWNGVIQRYHYIRTYRLWGAQMRYLVYGGELAGVQEQNMLVQGDRQARLPENQGKKNGRREHLLAALGFAAGSWHLASRDEFIGWTKEARTLNIKRVVNNVRFLILPWIKSPNLASRILGVSLDDCPVTGRRVTITDRFSLRHLFNWINTGGRVIRRPTG